MCAVRTITTDLKGVLMLMEHTLHTLKSLRLPGMAAAFEEQQSLAATTALSFDERFAQGDCIKTPMP